MNRGKAATHPLTYPRDGTYADLLCWHLYVWDTKPEGSTSHWSKTCWKDHEFLNAAFGKDGKDHYKKFLYWRGKMPGGPPSDFHAAQIANALFGNKPRFRLWARELEVARQRSRGRHNNPCNLSVEGAVAELAKGASQPKPPHASGVSSNQQLHDQLSRTGSSHDTLAGELGIRRELLEVLALRFGHDSPDDPDLTLLEFLKRKAAEHHLLKGRLSTLMERETRLENLIGSAHEALDNGNFAEVESLLSSAEERQNDETIAAIIKQAEIRASRGDAAHIAGDYDIGMDHYEKAASYFHSFDLKLEADSRIDLTSRAIERASIYRIRDRAAALIEPAFAHYHSDTLERAKLLYIKSNIIESFSTPLDSFGEIIIQTDAEKALDLLKKALLIDDLKADTELLKLVQKACALATHALGELYFNRWRLWPDQKKENSDLSIDYLNKSLIYCSQLQELTPDHGSKLWVDSLSIAFAALCKLIILSELNHNDMNKVTSQCLIVIRQTARYLEEYMAESTLYPNPEFTFDAMCELLSTQATTSSWLVLVNDIRKCFEIWDKQHRASGFDFKFKGWEMAAAKRPNAYNIVSADDVHPI